jgi:hypothetical protein
MSKGFSCLAMVPGGASFFFLPAALQLRRAENIFSKLDNIAVNSQKKRKEARKALPSGPPPPPHTRPPTWPQ